MAAMKAHIAHTLRPEMLPKMLQLMPTFSLATVFALYASVCVCAPPHFSINGV